MRRRTILGAVSVLGVTGCLRLEGGTGDPAETSTTTASTTTGGNGGETTTDAGTETETETMTGEPSPPYGMDEEGVRGVLYDMNRRALLPRAFETQFEKTNRNSGDVIYERAWRVADERALGTWDRVDGGAVETYCDEDRAWRERVNGEYTYGAKTGATNLRRQTWKAEVSPLIRGLEWSAPERVNETRPAEYTAEAVGVVPDSEAPGLLPGTITDLDEGMIRANENDVIREVDVTYSVATDSGSFNGTYRSVYRLPVLDGVSVSEPAWTDTAQDRRPRLSAARTDDGRFVRVRLEQGGPIVPGSRVTVYDTTRQDVGFYAYTSDPVLQGDELYVYRTDDDVRWDQGELAREDPPSTVTPPVLENEYEVMTFRGRSVYHDRVDVE